VEVVGDGYSHSPEEVRKIGLQPKDYQNLGKSGTYQLIGVSKSTIQKLSYNSPKSKFKMSQARFFIISLNSLKLYSIGNTKNWSIESLSILQ